MLGGVGDISMDVVYLPTLSMGEQLLISSLVLLAYQAVLSVVGLLSVPRCTQWTVNIFYLIHIRLLRFCYTDHAVICKVFIIN